MARETQRATRGGAELAASRIEIERLGVENAELKAVLGEVQKALEAANADVARYRELYEKGLPNRPERVASSEQQLVLEGLLESLEIDLPSAVNDAGPAENDAVAAPTGEAVPPSKAGNSPANDKSNRPHGRRRLDLSNLPVDSIRRRSSPSAAKATRWSALRSPIASRTPRLGTRACASCAARTGKTTLGPRTRRRATRSLRSSPLLPTTARRHPMSCS